MNNQKLAEFSEAELLAELLYRAMNRSRKPENELSNDASLLDMVDDFINQSSTEFNAQDVELFISEIYGVDIKRATISGYLSKRKSDGLLRKIGTQFIRE
jgi:hypothetical protein